MHSQYTRATPNQQAAMLRERTARRIKYSERLFNLVYNPAIPLGQPQAPLHQLFLEFHNNFKVYYNVYFKHLSNMEAYGDPAYVQAMDPYSDDLRLLLRELLAYVRNNYGDSIVRWCLQYRNDVDYFRGLVELIEVPLDDANENVAHRFHLPHTDPPVYLYTPTWMLIMRMFRRLQVNGEEQPHDIAWCHPEPIDEPPGASEMLRALPPNQRYQLLWEYLCICINCRYNFCTEGTEPYSGRHGVLFHGTLGVRVTTRLFTLLAIMGLYDMIVALCRRMRHQYVIGWVSTLRLNGPMVQQPAFNQIDGNHHSFFFANYGERTNELPVYSRQYSTIILMACNRQDFYVPFVPLSLLVDSQYQLTTLGYRLTPRSAEKRQERQVVADAMMERHRAFTLVKYSMHVCVLLWELVADGANLHISTSMSGFGNIYDEYDYPDPTRYPTALRGDLLLILLLYNPQFLPVLVQYRTPTGERYFQKELTARNVKGQTILDFMVHAILKYPLPANAPDDMTYLPFITPVDFVRQLVCMFIDVGVPHDGQPNGNSYAKSRFFPYAMYADRFIAGTPAVPATDTSPEIPEVPDSTEPEFVGMGIPNPLPPVFSREVLQNNARVLNEVTTDHPNFKLAVAAVLQPMYHRIQLAKVFLKREATASHAKRKALEMFLTDAGIYYDQDGKRPYKPAKKS